MIPLVFEHFGEMKLTATLINHLSKKSKDAGGLSSEADFRNR